MSNTKISSNATSRPKSKESFVTDVFTLVSGTAFAQFLAIIATPILTRFYSPDDFGLLTLFVSICGVLGVITCMRYELSIMLPKSDEEAVNLLGLSLFITSIISSLTVPVIWFGGQQFLSIISLPQLRSYLWMIPPFTFISGVFLSANYWNSRNKHFQRLSIARINRSIITTGIQLVAGFCGYATGGILIGANVAGQLLSTLILSCQIWRNDISLLRSISWEKMIYGLKKYRKFPLVDTWSSLLNTISWQLPSFLLAYFFSPAVVGFYSLGFQLLHLPMSFIGQSISQVFFQRAAESKSNGTLSSLVENVFRFFLIIGMFPVLTLTIIGDDVFNLVFGNNWTEAGVYTQILGLWALVWFISSPLSTLWVVMNKQEIGFKVTSLNLITRFLSLWVGGLLNNARLGLFLFSVSGILVYGYLCIKMLLISGVDFSKIQGIIKNNFILCIPIATILIILKVLETDKIILVLISFAFNLIYYLYILKTDSQMKGLLNRY